MVEKFKLGQPTTCKGNAQVFRKIFQGLRTHLKLEHTLFHRKVLRLLIVIKMQMYFPHVPFS